MAKEVLAVAVAGTVAVVSAVSALSLERKCAPHLSLTPWFPECH